MDHLVPLTTQSLPQSILLVLIGLPILAAAISGLCFKASLSGSSRWATAIIWVAGLIAILGLTTASRPGSPITGMGLRADTLSWIMATLILLVSGVVHHYSLRYMAGDRQYRRFFVLLSLLTSTALLMVLADHVLLLLAGWGFSNLLLVRLMIHKTSWKAAYYSGTLALQMFLLGFLFLTMALGILAEQTGSSSVHAILLTTAANSSSTTALLLIILAAMTQSALMPFHRWLTSSLNAPTPVSALMHAGLVNGGGFLLARFAPLYLGQHGLLMVLFIAGSATAAVGAFWKLIQSDVKRMLACSTMSQMGFMVMQCGLGLFPAAVAHLCWHGLFKAFLFLSVGSAMQENRLAVPQRPNSLPTFLLAGLGGVAGAYGFAVVSHKPFIAPDTTAILIGFAFVATTQVAQTVLRTGRLASRLVFSVVAALLAGILYGASVHAIETLLTPLAISKPQPLSSLHLMTFGLVFLAWVGMNLKSLIPHGSSRLQRALYVMALNGSQPHPDTTTPVRSAYQY